MNPEVLMMVAGVAGFWLVSAVALGMSLAAAIRRRNRQP